MASRRASKNVEKLGRTKSRDYNTLLLNDVLCPICRSILIEPVSLPCHHGFCLSCFESTMENTNLVCPLCRIRVGSWLRKAKKQAKLVNSDLWQVIKDKFSVQVKNKLNEIDEKYEEECEIIVAYPGEIRKEYEMQKEKEETEIKKKRDAEIKASEELIKKLKQDEEYKKAVMEEKLKLDELVAKKLAEELSFISPSTYKPKNSKKVGPMDRFIRKDNETVTSQNCDIQRKAMNNFATKEYTCRVLCLDNNLTKSYPREKVFSPIIKKKIQQIQKIVDVDVTSDGSDCIESEMRYFKPIDRRSNPPSDGKSPIKIPSIRALRNAAATILSPSGSINFHSNILESAFARISLVLPSTILNLPENSSGSSLLKRSCSEDELSTSKKRKNSKTEINNSSGKSSVLHISTTSVDAHVFEKFTKDFIRNEESSSPPFYGFDNSDSKKDKQNPGKDGRKNGVVNRTIDEDKKRQLLQEKTDLEFAKKLQEELNKPVHNTRSSRKKLDKSKTSRRQATLDEIFRNSYRVK